MSTERLTEQEAIYNGEPAQAEAEGSWVPIWLSLGVISLLLVCGAVGYWVLTTGFGFVSTLGAENSATKAVVESFMNAGEVNNPTAGYALFSPTRAGAEAKADVESMFSDNRQYFDGFESLDIRGFNLHSDNNGTTSTLSGTVRYAENPDVRFSADLVKEGGQWLLTDIRFAVGEDA